MVFPKPTDEFLKLAPEGNSTEQTIKLLKYIQDKEYELLSFR